ncbi:hypothetical protein [Pseudoalteromonas piscicida]|uniref:hypothetical protein n=1 Tax=Pseudoalteromonas piscicida TaxID=43662 RepID=UPI0030980DA5
MSFEMEQYKTEGFELFMSSWKARLAGASAQSLPHNHHDFWRAMRTRYAIDLSKQSALLQNVSLARYDTYLVLTALLYTNSLFESGDLIVGYNLPGHFFSAQGSDTRPCLSRSLLDSLKLNQPLCLVDEYFEHFEINTLAYERLSNANPSWHEVNSELGNIVSLVSNERTEQQLSTGLLHFIPQLFSGKQVAEQLNHLSEFY